MTRSSAPPQKTAAAWDEGKPKVADPNWSEWQALKDRKREYSFIKGLKTLDQIYCHFCALLKRISTIARPEMFVKFVQKSTSLNNDFPLFSFLLNATVPSNDSVKNRFVREKAQQSSGYDSFVNSDDQ
ncbi:MAG: hypothetical protein U0670_02020 [Anaerolineae bacterium]